MGDKPIWLKSAVMVLHAGAFVLLAGLNLCAQVRAPEVVIAPSGSVPALDASYRCIYSLKDIPYDKSAVQQCLDTVLASGHFDSGRVHTETEKDNKIRIVFELHSPQLILTQVSYDLKEPDKSKLERLLGENRHVLRTGAEYNQESEAATMAQISGFFFKQRRRVGVNSRLDLDFKGRKAKISFSIVEGPPGAGPGDLEFFTVDPDCVERIAVLDFRDADDYVPMSLVHHLMKAQPGSCLESSDLQTDIDYLRQTGLFSKVDYSVSGSTDAPEVSVSIVGRAISVSSVSVKCYGESSVECGRLASDVGFKVGDTYLQSKDRLARKKLEQLIKKTEPGAWVFADLSPQDGPALGISYGVILNHHQVFIDGKSAPDFGELPEGDSTRSGPVSVHRIIEPSR